MKWKWRLHVWKHRLWLVRVNAGRFILRKRLYMDLTPIFEPWEYQKPILDGHFVNFERDIQLRDVMAQANHGWFYGQKAVVHVSAIHPFTDYKPEIESYRKKRGGFIANPPLLLLSN